MTFPRKNLAFMAMLVLLFIFTRTACVIAQEGSQETSSETSEKTTTAEEIEEDPVVVYPGAFTVYQDGAANKTLFIKGEGFTDDLEFEFDPPISVGKRVTMTFLEDDETVAQAMFGLRLMKGKTWLKNPPALPYSVIYVVKVTRKGKAVFEPKEKVPIAQVYAHPELLSEYPAEKIKYDQTEFVIRGTNLSPTATKFVFEPELEARKDYTYAIDKEGTKMTLTLKRGGVVWRRTAGPIKVVAILGGAGRINLPKPVTVAHVVMGDKETVDPDESTESITPPVTLPDIYRTYEGTNEITLKGNGFRAERPPIIKFRGEGSAAQYADFDVTVVSKTEIVLRLKKNSVWLKKPGTLSISEFNDMPVTDVLDIAEVYETPEIDRDRKQLAFETQTLTIAVHGKGFVDGEVRLGLSPELKENEDYHVVVRDSRLLELELMDGKKWPKGALNVVWIQIGDAKKLIQNKDQPEKGIRVALIEPDFGGVVQVRASSKRIYQSETLSLTVDVAVLPPKFELKEGEDVPVQVVLVSSDASKKAIAKDRVVASLSVAENNAATLTLKLIDPKVDRWLNGDGRLFLAAILLPIGEDPKPVSFPLGNLNGPAESKSGVQIATVLPDIRVNYMNPAPIIFATQTSSIKLEGSGFTFSLANSFEGDMDETDAADNEDRKPAQEAVQTVIFDPPLKQDEDFMVIFENEKEIFVELMHEKRWRSTPGPLRLVSLDSGGGPVSIDVVIARVVDDDPEILCSNDCPREPAFDGHCGDMKPNPETGEFDCYGRDCADCGPRKKSQRPAKGSKTAEELCSDTCGEPFVNNGICDDGRPGAWSAQCPLCSDCKDCGPCKENKYSNLPMCTNGVEGSPGELIPGLPCVFPFTYKGVTYDGSTGCVKDGRVSGGWGWCPTTEDFERDGKWGSCQYCIDLLNDPTSLDEVMSDYYDEHDAVGTSGGAGRPRKQAQGFDLLRWLVNTLFFLVIFSAIGMLGVVLYRRRAGHRYQPVDTKAA